MNSVIFSIFEDKMGSSWNKKRQWLGILSFRERDSTFSLGFRSIESSVLDGARSKVALRGEGYAWAPSWWSSDNTKR